MVISISEKHHNDHKRWKNLLGFYEDEIKIYNKELFMLQEKHPGNLYIEEEVGDYKKFFLELYQEVKLMQHKVNQHEKQISKGILNADGLWQHHEIKEKMKGLEDDFKTLRKDFRKFMSIHI